MGGEVMSVVADSYQRLMCALGRHKQVLVTEADTMGLSNFTGYQGTQRIHCSYCDYVSEGVTASFSYRISEKKEKES